MALGWELRVERLGEQARGGERRTIGRYGVLHDGVIRSHLTGWTAEAPGPGDNRTPDNGLRIEAGTYPLTASLSDNYATLGYLLSEDPRASPKPCLGVGDTGARTYILVHPGHGFRISTGCINLAGELPTPEAEIDFGDSRDRVVALVEDLRAYLGPAFPAQNGRPLAGARLVIKGER